MQDIDAALRRLDSLEVELNQRALPGEPSTGSSAKDNLVDELFVAGVKAVGREVFGKTRTAGKIARRTLAAERKRAKQEQERLEKAQALQYLDRLEAVISAAASKLPPNTVLRLQRASAEARSAVRPDTVRRRTRKLIGAVRVELQGAAQLPAPEFLLKELECSLRAFIADRLSADSKWWKTRVPPDVRKRAEERASGSSNLVDFIDFGDYSKIILQRNNWHEHFRHVFPSKDWISTRLAELLPLRNDLAHSRPLSYDDAMKFRLFAQDTLDQLD